MGLNCGTEGQEGDRSMQMECWMLETCPTHTQMWNFSNEPFDSKWQTLHFSPTFQHISPKNKDIFLKGTTPLPHFF